MQINLFVLIEDFFEGTVLFVLKFVITLLRIIRHPIKGSILGYESFKACRAREIGPATFLVICVFAFWTSVLALIFFSERLYPAPIIASRLEALDASPLRVPVLLVVVATALTVFLAEVTFRVVGWSFARLRVWPDNDLGRHEKWLAVGRYTIGSMGIIFTLMIALIGIARWTMPSVVQASSFWNNLIIVTGVTTIVLLIFAAYSRALANFAISLGSRDVRPGIRIASPLFLFVLSITAFVLSMIVATRLSGVLTDAPRPLITNLRCERNFNSGASVLAVVTIRNDGRNAQLLDTSSWHLRITNNQGGFYQSDNGSVRIDGRTNPPYTLMRPRSVMYVTVGFPVKAGEIPGGWVKCSIWADPRRLYFEEGSWLGTY